MSQQRSGMFFNSDPSMLAEQVAYQLGEDYGFSEDETVQLTEAIEKVIHEFFARRGSA